MAHDVYAEIPILENDNFLLRRIDDKADAEDLLKVYSDEKSVPFFNSDNCNGDTFFYKTIEEMKKAIDFWRFAYEHKYFVRWAIVHKSDNGYFLPLRKTRKLWRWNSICCRRHS